MARNEPSHAADSCGGMMLLGWLAALTGTLAYGAGSVLQGWAATRTTGPAVVRHPAYVAGLACDGLAWVASLVAFRLLPLLVVQAVLAGSVAVTVVLARIFLHTRLRRRDLAAIVLLTAALAGLATAFQSIGTTHPPAGLTGWVLLALGLVAALLAWGYRAATSVPLALLAGAAFSGASVCARTLGLGSVGTLVTQPLAWALVGFGLVGTFAYARSLERGPVGPATAVLWAVETVAAGVVGVAVLGDQVRAGGAWWTLVEVLVVILGCAVLATGLDEADRAPGVRPPPLPP